MDSGPAALYSLFWVRLISGTFYDELPEELWPGPGDTAMVAVRSLLEQPDNRWWDDAATTEVEARDDILRQALAEAYDEAESRMGTNTASWAWGKLHVATFRNAMLGRSGISLVESIFNRGPIATSGGTDAVNATGWRISKPSDTRRQAKTFEVSSVPSMRMIVDLSNFGNSLTMHTTGQSGHAFSPHYDDMIDSWRLIQYHPMLWDKAAVEAASKGHLVLMP